MKALFGLLAGVLAVGAAVAAPCEFTTQYRSPPSEVWFVGGSYTGTEGGKACPVFLNDVINNHGGQGAQCVGDASGGFVATATINGNFFEWRTESTLFCAADPPPPEPPASAASGGQGGTVEDWKRLHALGNALLAVLGVVLATSGYQTGLKHGS